MENIRKRCSLSQPHCRECHRPLTTHIVMKQTINDASTWEGVPLRGGTRQIFLCESHPPEKYEQDGYTLVGVFEWEHGVPA